MAAQAFCTTCQRMVYIEAGDTAVCPVCSSPLIESPEGAGEEAGTADEETAATESA